MKRVLGIVLFVICWSAGVNAQTIADIARSERAKRNNAPKTTTAPINNARVSKAKPGAEVGSPPAEPVPSVTPAPDPAPPLKVSPIPANAPTTQAAQPDKPAEAKPPAGAQPEPKKDSRDEEWWRTAFEKARTEIRRAENQAAVAQLELNAANRDYLTRAYDPDGRGPTAIGAATAKLDASKKNVEQARTNLAALEEELRRSGAPAGWAR
jgi:hypothetical protein